MSEHAHDRRAEHHFGVPEERGEEKMNTDELLEMMTAIEDALNDRGLYDLADDLLRLRHEVSEELEVQDLTEELV